MPGRKGPELIVDDGGGATLLLHKGLEHMLKMKDQAIVCSIGHFDNGQ